MKERGTYLVPTLMAGEYAGGRKATRKYPPEIAAKALQALDGRSSAFKRAAGAGVKIAFGTDSGVSPHGRNAEEFKLLVEHGLSAARRPCARRPPRRRCSASIASPARSTPARKPTSSPSPATC